MAINHIAIRKFITNFLNHVQGAPLYSYPYTWVPMWSYTYTTGALVNRRVVAFSNYINKKASILH